MSRVTWISVDNDYACWVEEWRSIKRSNDYRVTTQLFPLFCPTPADGGSRHLTGVNQITAWPLSQHCSVQYYLPFSNWLRISVAGSLLSTRRSAKKADKTKNTHQKNMYVWNMIFLWYHIFLFIDFLNSKLLSNYYTQIRIFFTIIWFRFLSILNCLNIVVNSIIIPR